MKNTFWAQRPREENEIMAFFADNKCIIVFDTNVLLGLYRTKEKECKKLIKLMKSYSNRLRLPHHVALEFFNNRTNIIKTDSLREQKDLLSKYDRIINDINTVKNTFKDVEKDFTKKNKVNSIKESIDGLGKSFKDEKEALKKQIDEEINKLISKDWILNEIYSLFDNRMWKGFNREEKEKLDITGAARYSKCIPPGYMDSPKKEGDKNIGTIYGNNNLYGDYYVWMEIIENCKNSKKDLIFVTDDQKCDWYRLDSDKKILGPNPLLLQEFLEETKHKCHIMNFKSFIEFSNKHYGDSRINISEDFLDIWTEGLETSKKPEPFNILNISEANNNFKRVIEYTDFNEKSIKIRQLDKQLSEYKLKLHSLHERIANSSNNTEDVDSVSNMFLHPILDLLNKLYQLDNKHDNDYFQNGIEVINQIDKFLKTNEPLIELLF